MEFQGGGDDEEEKDDSEDDEEEKVVSGKCVVDSDSDDSDLDGGI